MIKVIACCLGTTYLEVWSHRHFYFIYEQQEKTDTYEREHLMYLIIYHIEQFLKSPFWIFVIDFKLYILHKCV